MAAADVATTSVLTSGDAVGTRLAVPGAAPDLVRRPALHDRLSEAATAPLTLVAAPAGAGKTTLVSAWARDRGAPGPLAWISLDGEQLTRRRFWTLVLQGIESALPDRPRLRMPGPIDAVLVGLLNHVAELGEPLVVVLDDFHAVADAGVLADLNVLLEHPPDQLRLVVLSRRDPPLRLVRLRVSGRMAELRATDLAFGDRDGTAFLRAAVPGLSAADAGVLVRRTEGWAAGLRMAVLSLRDHADPHAFVAAFAGTDAAVADYLLSEVLDRQSAHDRRLLLHLALPDAVCGGVVDALTRGSDGERVLRRLAQDDAMLQGIDARPGWFRFHPLLRDLLRAELTAEDGAEVPRLHRDAARWLATHGEPGPAARHAIAGGDLGLAAAVVGRSWVEVFVEGGAAPLRALVEALPPAAVAAEPELLLAAAAVHVEDGEVEQARRALASAVTASDAMPEQHRARFRLAHMVVALRLARLHGDLDEGLALARCDVTADVAAVDAPGLAALATASIGIAELWAGDRDRAAERLEAALGEADRGGHAYVGALALAHLALYDAFEGRLQRAHERSRAAIGVLERHGRTRTSAAAAAYGVLGGVEGLWDDAVSAVSTLERAGEALQHAPERPLRALIAVARIRALAALGEHERAYAALRLEQVVLGDFRQTHLSAILDAQEGLLLEALGERAAARAALGAAHERDATPEVAVALGRLRLSDGRPDEALALVEPVTGPGAAPALLSTRVQALGVEALARDALVDHERAGDALAHALDLAEARGTRRLLTELGPSLRPVLHRELRRGTAHRALVGELVDALDGARRGRRGTGRPSEPLSDRELMVLRFLPTMQSNREIAGELFVSVNTLKTHLRQIYRKLDVATRRDAVVRARDMGLLAPGPGGRDL